uniref:Uncharacterized protein n=1 Tax=Schistosoma mansoni TaxID=6183 RepID=A0A5K4EXR0_SCHMA
MSSDRGIPRDRYDIFRIRQGMRPRSTDEAYIDLSNNPMIDGLAQTVLVYKNREATGKQRGDNSDGSYSEQTSGGKNMSNCSYQQDFGENLGPLVTYRVDDASKLGVKQYH